MTSLATIFTGDADAADVFFLIGSILAALAGLISLFLARAALVGALPMALVAFAVACASFGLLLL
jgi:hypothetical protein